MTTSSRIAPSAKRAIVRMLMIATAIAAVVVISPAALAQHRAAFGTTDEAKTMLMKAVAAVKEDKGRALAMFSEGEGGFLDRDLHPFCVNVSDGKFVALNRGHADQHFGQNIRTIVDFGQGIRNIIDLRGREFGRAQFAAAQKPEGDVTEVSYLVPNSGVHRTPLQRMSVTTRVGDLVCGVSYYPSAAYWTFEQAGG